jgi:hypothetical protein
MSQLFANFSGQSSGKKSATVLRVYGKAIGQFGTIFFSRVQKKTALGKTYTFETKVMHNGGS